MIMKKGKNEVISPRFFYSKVWVEGEFINAYLNKKGGIYE